MREKPSKKVFKQKPSKNSPRKVSGKSRLKREREREMAKGGVMPTAADAERRQGGESKPPTPKEGKVEAADQEAAPQMQIGGMTAET